jgi:hypothetical protein
MRFVSTCGVLAAAALLCAQNGPPVEARAANNPGGTGATITVLNHYTSPLVAFVFIYTMRDKESTVYGANTVSYDSAIDPAQNPPVPARGETRIPYYSGQSGLKPQANIEGALFADGTTFGQHDMIDSIFERRNYAMVTVNRAIAELKQAAKDSLTRQQLAQQMQQAMMEERSTPDHVGYNGTNALVNTILTIRNQVLMDLMNARDPATGAPLAMEKWLPAEIEALSHRKEALAPPKP